MFSKNTALKFWSFRSMLFTGVALLISAGLAWQSPVAQAQSGKNFYRGKKISVIIGYRPGGSYGTYGRMLARHLGAQLPGNPTLVPKNMPGAGSLVASNYLYKIAPRDGSTLGVIGQSVYLMQQL